jgi:hypothetical protein
MGYARWMQASVIPGSMKDYALILWWGALAILKAGRWWPTRQDEDWRGCTSVNFEEGQWLDRNAVVIVG